MTNKYFETLIMVLAIASCVVLALDDIKSKRGESTMKNRVLRNLDASFTAVFGAEVRGLE